MGWWPWSSSSTSNDVSTSATPPLSEDAQSNAQPTKRDFSLTDEQRMRIFGKPGPNTSSSSRDEQADSELSAFLREIGASPDGSLDAATGAPVTATVRKEAQATDSTGRLVNPDGSLDISTEALLPRTMSCREAFDQAFYCQSLGGKFNDIYRYGHLQSCSEHWGAFWFCMRTRTMAPKDKEELVKGFYRDRDERRKKEHGSSEDVWDLRTKAVERAFWRDPDENTGTQRGVAVKE